VKHRILVVEDNRFNLELLQDWLDAEGHEVLTAESLQEGIAALETGTLDAVLLDIQLGVDDGLSLISLIRQKAGAIAIPVIAVTAHALALEQQGILQAGCNEVLSKPIDFSVLRESLARWLSP
jgi:CheY-like chemotaxis protein